MLDKFAKEIVLHMCQFIDTTQSLKALRLICKNTEEEPIEMLFETNFVGRYLYSVTNLKSICQTPHLAKQVKHIVCCPTEIGVAITTTEALHEAVMWSHKYDYGISAPREVTALSTCRHLIFEGQELSLAPLDAYHLDDSSQSLRNLESTLAWSHPNESCLNVWGSRVFVASPVDICVREKTSLLPHCPSSLRMSGATMAAIIHRSLRTLTSKLHSPSLAIDIMSYQSDFAHEHVPIRHSIGPGYRGIDATGIQACRFTSLGLRYTFSKPDGVIARPEDFDDYIANSQNRLASLKSLAALNVSGLYNFVRLTPLESVTFPNLTRINFENVAGIRVNHFLDFITRHAVTLRALNIVECHLIDGEVWEEVTFGLAHIKLDRDMNFTIKRIWPEWDEPRKQMAQKSNLAVVAAATDERLCSEAGFLA